MGITLRIHSADVVCGFSHALQELVRIYLTGAQWVIVMLHARAQQARECSRFKVRKTCHSENSRILGTV